MTRRGWLLFSALCLIWGIPYLLIRVAVGEFHPLVVAFGRTLIGGLLLLPIALRRGALRPLLRHWKVLVVYTVIEISGPWLLLGYAETRLTSSTAGLLIATVPLITAVLLAASGGERMTSRRTIGLVTGLAGVLVLVGLDIDLADFGAVAALAGTAVGYAVGPILISRHFRDVPATGVITASLLLAAVLYTPFLPAVWPTAASAAATWSVTGLGVICTAIGFLVFFALIAEAGPVRATVITYVNPAVALALGVAILNEPFTAGMAFGFPLVILGSILATTRDPRPATEPAAAAAAAADTPEGSDPAVAGAGTATTAPPGPEGAGQRE